MAKQTVKVGVQFRAVYADGNCLWKVIKALGRGSWLCEIQNEPFEFDGRMLDSDYAGTQKAFLTREIQGSMNWESFMDETGNEMDQWYASLTPGQIVHYDNGFNEFVRCEVTDDRQLMPIALVGEWKEWDLPRRMIDGSINWGYYAQKVQEREPFQPNASNVYEFRLTHNSGGWDNECKIDPRQLAPITFAVPEHTPEEAAKAKLIRGINDIHNLVSGDGVYDNPRAVLKAIAEKIVETLNA